MGPVWIQEYLGFKVAKEMGQEIHGRGQTENILIHEDGKESKVGYEGWVWDAYMEQQGLGEGEQVW